LLRLLAAVFRVVAVEARIVRQMPVATS